MEEIEEIIFQRLNVMEMAMKQAAELLIDAYTQKGFIEQLLLMKRDMKKKEQG